MDKGTSHKAQINRLRRIEGQTRGLAKMIEDERYCIDILIQVKAIKSALSSVEVRIVEEHMKHCVSEAVKATDKKKRDRVLKEVLALLKASTK